MKQSAQLGRLGAIALVYAKNFNAALHALRRPGDRIYSAKNPMPRSGRKYIIAGNAISTRASGV
jgi:hypothetical protein